MSVENPKNLIRDVLKKHPEGLTISSIAQMSGLHRHTSRKYINELTKAGEVVQRLVGAAKLCYFNQISNENKVIEKRSFFERFNLKLVLSVVLLTFLLSEVVILAYENESFNETMINNYSNTNPITASMILNDSNVTQIIAETIENASNSSVEINDSLVPIVNETSIIDNTTLNNTSVTPNETPLESYLKFNINFEYPQKITRGEIMGIKAIITNVNSLTVKNVILTWQLPNDFEIISGDRSKICGNLEPSEICDSEITVKTTLSTTLGKNDLKVVINYEE